MKKNDNAHICMALISKTAAAAAAAKQLSTPVPLNGQTQIFYPQLKESMTLQTQHKVVFYHDVASTKQ